jgi:hypothetical protein
MNLDKSDFRLFDNGQAQVITDFERHMSQSSQPAPVSLGEKTVIPAPLPESRLNRKFFILIDQDANDLTKSVDFC